MTPEEAIKQGRESSYGSVPYGTVMKALKQIQDHYPDQDVSDIQLSFEYLVGSFFPDIMKNIILAMEKEHTAGYIEGINASKKNDDD